MHDDLVEFLNTLLKDGACRVRINSNQFTKFFIDRRKHELWNSVRWDEVKLVETERTIIDFTQEEK